MMNDDEKEVSARDVLLDNGYEDVVIFENYSYDTALIGVSHDNRAIYDYEKMVEWLMEKEGFTMEEAVEWIDYNTIRSIPYGGENTQSSCILFLISSKKTQKTKMPHHHLGDES